MLSTVGYQFTFTVAGNGDTITFPSIGGYFSLQVVGTDAVATAWNVVFEGGNDNVNFDTILTHTDITGNGKMVFAGTQKTPCKYFRVRCVSVTLGGATNIIAYVAGTQ